MPSPIDATRHTVTEFANVWNTRDLSQLDSLVDTNYKQHHAGAPQGLEGLKQYMQQQFDKMPDLHTTLEDTVCEADRAVARIHLHFTKDGKKMLGEIIDVWHLTGGKLAEHWSADPVVSPAPSH